MFHLRLVKDGGSQRVMNPDLIKDDPKNYKSGKNGFNAYVVNGFSKITN